MAQKRETSAQRSSRRLTARFTTQMSYRGSGRRLSNPEEEKKGGWGGGGGREEGSGSSKSAKFPGLVLF